MMPNMNTIIPSAITAVVTTLFTSQTYRLPEERSSIGNLAVNIITHLGVMFARYGLKGNPIMGQGGLRAACALLGAGVSWIATSAVSNLAKDQIEECNKGQKNEGFFSKVKLAIGFVIPLITAIGALYGAKQLGNLSYFKG